VGSHAPEFSSTGDLASLSYVRNIFTNFWKKVLVRIHFIIMMIRWTGRAPEFLSTGDLASLRYVRNIFTNFWQKVERESSLLTTYWSEST
jgi:hypothetical protein